MKHLRLKEHGAQSQQIRAGISYVFCLHCSVEIVAVVFCNFMFLVVIGFFNTMLCGELLQLFNPDHLSLALLCSKTYSNDCHRNRSHILG